MESKIVYGSDGWKIIIKNLWNRARAVNMDFRGIPDKEKFIIHTLGKEAFKIMSENPDWDITLRITGANVGFKNNDKKWEQSDTVNTYEELIIIIEEIMDKEDKVTILITGVDCDGVMDNTDRLLESVFLSKPEKSYISILNAVKSTSSDAEIGYIISNEHAEEILKDYNLELKCGHGDINNEKSAVFIYKGKPVRIKQKDDKTWFIYRVQLSDYL